MKYENFEEASRLVKEIEQNQKILNDLGRVTYIRLSMSELSTALSVYIPHKDADRPDDPVVIDAQRFLEFTAQCYREKIANLKSELETL